MDVSLIGERTEKLQQRTDGTTPEQDDLRLLISVGYEF